MMLDRQYSAVEVAEIAARGSAAMEKGNVPEVVVLAAHVAAAATILEDALMVGPVSPDFQKASRLLDVIARLFLLVCETGPVSAGTKQ